MNSTRDNEHSSRVKNNTWTSVNIPERRKAIDCRWLFKYNADGSVERSEARLVAKGIFTRAWSRLRRNVFNCTKLYIDSVFVGNCKPVELKSASIASKALLNSELEEEIDMNQPKGCVKEGEEDFICKLNQSIYGLKQSSRCWFNTMDEFLKNSCYVQSSSVTCLYIKREEQDVIVIALYVDDLIPASNDKSM